MESKATMTTLAESTATRRVAVQVINEAAPTERSKLEDREGQVWTTDEVRDDFDIIGFAAPMVVARRKSDGEKGTLFFQHEPRFYFGWQKA